MKTGLEQESNPVGCVPPALPQYVIQKPPDVSIWRGIVLGGIGLGGTVGGMVLGGTALPPRRQNDRRLRKCYLPLTSLAGGKYPANAVRVYIEIYLLSSIQFLSSIQIFIYKCLPNSTLSLLTCYPESNHTSHSFNFRGG